MSSTTQVSGISGVAARARAARVAAAALAAIALFSAAATPALALDVSGIFNGIIEFLSVPIKGFFIALVDIIRGAMDTLNSVCVSIRADAGLGFSGTYADGSISIQGASGNDFTSVLSALNSILMTGARAAMVPAGLIVSIVFAVKCVKTVMEPDGGPSGIPYFEKLAWILVQYAIFKGLIDYSVDITAAVFNEVQRITSTIGVGGDMSGAISDWRELMVSNIENGWALTVDNAGTLLLDALGYGAVFIVSVIVAVTTIMSVYARWIQAFIYLLAAPLFFSLAGLGETRPIFIGYLKSFAALALAFTFTVVLIGLAQTVFIGQVVTVHGASNRFGIDVYTLVVTIAVGLIVSRGLRSCGSWAKELVG